MRSSPLGAAIATLADLELQTTALGAAVGDGGKSSAATSTEILRSAAHLHLLLDIILERTGIVLKFLEEALDVARHHY